MRKVIYILILAFFLCVNKAYVNASDLSVNDAIYNAFFSKGFNVRMKDIDTFVSADVNKYGYIVYCFEEKCYAVRFPKELEPCVTSEGLCFVNQTDTSTSSNSAEHIVVYSVSDDLFDGQYVLYLKYDKGWVGPHAHSDYVVIDSLRYSTHIVYSNLECTKVFFWETPKLILPQMAKELKTEKVLREILCLTPLLVGLLCLLIGLWKVLKMLRMLLIRA